MKKIVIALMCLVTSSAFAQSYKGYPDIPDNTVGYATQVIDYSPGTGVSEQYKHSEYILGEPDYYTTTNSFALGNSGSIVVGFSPFIIKPSGDNSADFYIYEVETYEPWDAYVSNDLENWVKAPVVFKDVTATTGGTKGRGSVVGYDVDAISATDTYKYVKIVDTSNSGFANSAGSDIDAVVVTSAVYSGNGAIVDTDSRNGLVYNLMSDQETGAVGVKIIDKQDGVRYIPFSTDASLEPVALSVQGNFNCDDEKDINVLAIKSDTKVPLNIIKDQAGNDIRTIDNSVVN